MPPKTFGTVKRSHLTHYKNLSNLESRLLLWLYGMGWPEAPPFLSIRAVAREMEKDFKSIQTARRGLILCGIISGEDWVPAIGLGDGVTPSPRWPHAITPMAPRHHFDGPTPSEEVTNEPMNQIEEEAAPLLMVASKLVDGVKEAAKETEGVVIAKTNPKAAKQAKAEDPDTFPDCLQVPGFLSRWEEWRKHHKEKTRKPMTKAARSRQLKFLEALGPYEAARAMELAMFNSWQGLNYYKKGDDRLPEALEPTDISKPGADPEAANQWNAAAEKWKT